MNRGPKPGLGKTDFVERAKAAWGGSLPDWLCALAEEATRTTAKAAAARVGYSGAVISTVFSNTYRAPLDPIEAAVRAALMRDVIRCPGLDADITGDECVANQKLKFSSANPRAVRLYYACRGGCPHATRGQS